MVIITLSAPSGVHEMVRCKLQMALTMATNWCGCKGHKIRINDDATLRILYYSDENGIHEVKEKPVQSDRHRVAITATEG